MTDQRTLTLISAGLVVLSLSGGSALAATLGDTAEANALHQDAQISLAQAIELAQARTGGLAAGAEFEAEDDEIVWTIETISRDGTEMEVEIDAVTGAVLEVETEGEDEDEEE